MNQWEIAIKAIDTQIAQYRKRLEDAKDAEDWSEAFKADSAISVLEVVRVIINTCYERSR